MAIYHMDLRVIEQMLQNLGKKPQQVRPIGKGSLISFQYLYAKAGHPRSPMVLVTDWVYPPPPKPSQFIRGINMQYLTPDSIGKLLDQRIGGCNNPQFSYDHIKGYAFIKGAFRQYKKSGMANLRQFNCDWLSDLIREMQGIDINEIYQFQKQVNDQIARATNPVAAATVTPGS